LHHWSLNSLSQTFWVLVESVDEHLIIILVFSAFFELL
jgi:hypothetical protein